MGKLSIGIIIGSPRRDSYSKKIAIHLDGLLEEQFETRFLDITSLSLYNQDLDNESDMPYEWKRFRQEVKSVNAVLFVTPEYNRSMTPTLKNAIDIASRPMSDNAWSGKPSAIVSISQGSFGGFGGNHHLRQSAVCVNLCVMPRPEAYIGYIAELFNADGALEEETQTFLRSFADAFANWINKFNG
ncbi:MAG: NAD(P)H-dependent oxidoreductase [Oscillospiraceae bacterium]|nr:NAD(P)H-dependent oxidoreductase [Oscillospiraceae bacterium]